MVSKKESVFYLCNHFDNINSAKFFEENNLIFMDNVFVKTKEGSLTLWNIEHDTCIIKWNVNNFTFIKPYRINNHQIVTPINHDGDIAIYDLKIEQETNSHNYFFNPKKTNTCEDILNYDDSKGYNTNDNFFFYLIKRLLHLMIYKKVENVESIYINTEHNNNDNCYGYNKKNIEMYKEIIVTNPIPYLGETYIMVCYKLSLFCLYDYRMTTNCVKYFILNNMNDTILSYHMNNIVIRSDDKILLSITNSCNINIYNLNNIKKIDHISSYKFNYLNFIDFHKLSLFFAVAENSKIFIWDQPASYYNKDIKI
ncbi:conserved Plasmodium protein, unknown function [Plasmodium sp. gorilla clade G2]|uniref:conserved Plasmodium protein, unknown function n=1 Tax=Plasmodium sp. gorilla clade G2 TaxID=880535 RepID=UPI000D214F0E|nr:conserved Plasmodium protein, unknown function [Plasmodium sp. gorilla clade G2]SOV18466.1 conserved Plasmodium protein, unknown function [Plasmodium sp. gorilla clade G2]